MQPHYGAPISRDDLDFAQKKGKELFGDRHWIFCSDGFWYVGKFLDNLPPIASKGRDARSPWHRPQRLFGRGRTIREAFRFATGAATLFSIPGMSPGAKMAAGYKPIYRKNGSIRGFESSAGVFSRTWPAREDA